MTRFSCIVALVVTGIGLAVVQAAKPAAQPMPLAEPPVDGLRRAKSELARQAWEKARAKQYHDAQLLMENALNTHVAFDRASLIVFDLGRKFGRGELDVGEAMRIRSGVKRPETMRWVRWIAENFADMIVPPEAAAATTAATAAAKSRNRQKGIPSPTKKTDKEVTIGEAWRTFTRSLQVGNSLPEAWKQ